MEKRMKELLPYMRRLHHLHELAPAHVELITSKPPRIIEFKVKDTTNEPKPR